MLEPLNDVAKDAVDKGKKTIAKRFGGVLPAYIVTSWLAFNWSNIAFLFMSKATVEQRIQAIAGIPNLLMIYLVCPIVVGFILALVTPLAEWGISVATSNFNVKAKRAEEVADANLDKYIKGIKEITFQTENRIGKLTFERDSLREEVKELTKKSDELLRSITRSYDSLASIVLRANYLQEKLNEFKLSKQLTPSELQNFLNKTFPQSERIEALQRRSVLEANLGPTASNYLLDGKPKPLEANIELVKELLIVTGVIGKETLAETIKQDLPNNPKKENSGPDLEKTNPQT